MIKSSWSFSGISLGIDDTTKIDTTHNPCDDLTKDDFREIRAQLKRCWEQDSVVIYLKKENEKLRDSHAHLIEATKNLEADNRQKKELLKRKDQEIERLLKKNKGAKLGLGIPLGVAGATIVTLSIIKSQK